MMGNLVPLSLLALTEHGSEKFVGVALNPVERSQSSKYKTISCPLDGAIGSGYTAPQYMALPLFVSLSAKAGARKTDFGPIRDTAANTDLTRFDSM